MILASAAVVALGGCGTLVSVQDDPSHNGLQRSPRPYLVSGLAVAAMHFIHFIRFIAVIRFTDPA
jgi:hypothetical protein